MCCVENNRINRMATPSVTSRRKRSAAQAGLEDISPSPADVAVASLQTPASSTSSQATPSSAKRQKVEEKELQDLTQRLTTYINVQRDRDVFGLPRFANRFKFFSLTARGF